MLALSEYAVERAYNPQSALASVERFKPVVALIDIDLGSVNGAELVPQLRERHPDLICVMVTAGGDVDSAIEAVHRGAYDYLKKPVSRDEILLSLSRCFERHRLERDKRSAERRLYESEQRFRAVFDHSPSSITLTDQEGRYRLVNSRFEAWTGVSRNQAIGKLPSELFPARQSDSWERPDTAVMERGERVDYEWKVSVPGRQELNLSITKFPVFGHDGTLLGVGTIGSDISALRETQAQLAEIQKMEAVGRLTGGMAHEFNNLLQAVTGYLELVELGLQEERTRLKKPEALHRHLASAFMACDTAAGITNSLLAYGRKQPLRPSAIHLSDLVIEMDDILRGVLGEMIVFRTVFSGEIWPARADRSQMQSALINLVLNARDAMEEEGSLNIEMSNATATNAMIRGVHVSPGEYVRLTVSDTGCGIAPEKLDHVFEPFYTTKDVGKGTGLGLSMVHGFVTQSGGFVDIQSQLGEGTRIDLYLPRFREGEIEDNRETRLQGTG